MVDWKKLRDLNNHGLLIDRVEGRFSFTRNGYRFDRYLVRGVLIFVMVLLASAFIYGLQHGVKLHELFYQCPYNETTGCNNPYYLNCKDDFCKGIEFTPHFMAGQSVGERPDAAFMMIEWWAARIAVTISLLALVVNHFLYNRGKFPLDVEFDKEKKEDK